MTMKRTYQVETFEPRVSVMEAREYKVRPEWKHWLENEMNRFNGILDDYLSGYVLHNGRVRAIKLVRTLFGMDLRTAFDFTKEHYSIEIAQYKKAEAYRESDEAFRNIANAHRFWAGQPDGDEDE